MRLTSAFAVLLCTVAFGTLVPQIRADTYQYDYSLYVPGSGGYSFDYDSPSLITTDESFLTPLNCMAVGESCDQIGILATSGDIRIYGANSLSDTNLPPSFFQLGTHTNGFSSLTITEESSASPVPEPSSLALLGTGLLGVVVRIQRSRLLR